MSYAFIFAFAFLGITGVIYFLNNNFENIFAFNFGPPQEKKEEPIVERKLNLDNSKLDAYTKKVIKEVQNELMASLAKYNKGGYADTVYKEVVKVVPDPQVVDSLNTVIRAKKEVEKNFAEKEKELEKLREALGLNNKKEYNDWIASTVKLYESMDAKQAAKIITNYSDNVARDIIYAMKKKKAAEILSNLNSEQIVKLTRADDGL